MTSVCLVADCLKSYDKYREINIMMRLGPTLLGHKPIHIFCFNQSFKFINQILNDLHQLFSSSTRIKYRIVYSHNNSIKVILYNKHTTKRLLSDKGIRRFLSSHGYDNTLTDEDFMTLLSEQLKNNQLPSEYGVFFGYPLKDVIGFMGHPKLKHVKTTAWKVYGNPTLSDKVYANFQRAEQEILALCQALPLEGVVSRLNLV